MSGNSTKIIAYNYFGGKFTWLDYLYANFPIDFNHLVDVFGGSFCVSLNYRGRVIKTANEINDDPTIRRCIGFAKSWGFGGLYVCNLFAFRATNPKELLKVDNPFGDQNIWHTRKLSDEVEMIICAWGNYPIVKKILRYENAPINLLDFCINKLHSIDTTVKGVPKHPLYLKSELKPKRWAYKYEGR